MRPLIVPQLAEVSLRARRRTASGAVREIRKFQFNGTDSAGFSDLINEIRSHLEAADWFFQPAAGKTRRLIKPEARSRVMQLQAQLGDGAESESVSSVTV